MFLLIIIKTKKNVKNSLAKFLLISFTYISFRVFCKRLIQKIQTIQPIGFKSNIN